MPKTLDKVELLWYYIPVTEKYRGAAFKSSRHPGRRQRYDDGRKGNPPKGSPAARPLAMQTTSALLS